MDKEKVVVIDGVEYVQKVEEVAEEVSTTQSAQKEPFFSFLKSPQFWMIGIASASSILMQGDFQTLPWNQIVGQTLALWGSGSSAFGLLNKMTKNVSSK